MEKTRLENLRRLAYNIIHKEWRRKETTPMLDEKDIQIMLTGDGPRRKYLEKLAKKLKFTNPPIQKLYKHENLNEALWCGDLYVHTSIVEIEAISCLEAIACGMVPVIADSKKSATKKFALDERCLYSGQHISNSFI